MLHLSTTSRPHTFGKNPSHDLRCLFLFVIDREVFSDQMEQQKDVKPRNRTKKTWQIDMVCFISYFFLVPLPDLLWQQLQSRGMDSVLVKVEDFEVRQHSSIAAGWCRSGEFENLRGFVFRNFGWITWTNSEGYIYIIYNIYIYIFMMMVMIMMDKFSWGIGAVKLMGTWWLLKLEGLANF